MRIPEDHSLLHAYITNFNVDSLFPFEMENKFIHLSGYLGGTTLTYDDFKDKLSKKDAELLKLFPTLKDTKNGLTCDELFNKAVAPVVDLFDMVYNSTPGGDSAQIHAAYQPSPKHTTSTLCVPT